MRQRSNSAAVSRKGQLPWAEISAGGRGALHTARSVNQRGSPIAARLFGILKFHPSMHIKKKPLFSTAATPLYPNTRQVSKIR
jgi:hypothetical protein